MSDAIDLSELEALRRIVLSLRGQRLPGERELADRLGISRPKLRGLLTILQREGLIESRPKSGTYAIDPLLPRLSRVALLIDSHLKLGDDPFFSLLAEALQRNVQSAGAQCTIVRTDGQKPSFEDGAITLGLSGHELLRAQAAGDPPMVCLLLEAASRATRRASVFSLEDREAGSEAASLLLRRGCREILFLGRRDIPASRDRFAGANAVAREAGVSLQFVGSHLSYAAGLRLGAGMDLSTGDGPVGIIATNDWMALGLRMGLSQRPVPALRPVEIASFDGLPLTAEPSLRISSLSVPIAQIAADAVDELKRLVYTPGAAGRNIRYHMSWRQPGETG